jgi:pseudouridine-5'-phosphate glycosidase
MSLPKWFVVSSEVKEALAENRPVVALESTVITHGLPYPENLALASNMECEVRMVGATPAMIIVLEGNIVVGARLEQVERLAGSENVHKISSRDLAPAIAKGWSGGTTVAGTVIVAHTMGIRIFATGGIGGVHRQPKYDISADLPQLATTPMVVVCSGAKAILDLPATLEILETMAVPVVGYQTDEFPAFYSPTSGLKVNVRAETFEEIAEIARTHWGTGMLSAVLVTVPPPMELALSPEDMEAAIQKALKEAEFHKVSGQQVTPFLLRRVAELTGGASLNANLGLLRNNARVAGEIARYLTNGLSVQGVSD